MSDALIMAGIIFLVVVAALLIAWCFGLFDEDLHQ